jgi:hypothetical protein
MSAARAVIGRSGRVRTARRLAVTVAACGAAWLVFACADRVSGPARSDGRFSIPAEQRAALAAGILFAGSEASLAALADRERAAHISAAFERLADRIEHDDAPGASTALDAARAALTAYGSGTDAGMVALLEIERLSVALEHLSLLSGASPARALYVGSPAGGSR